MERNEDIRPRNTLSLKDTIQMSPIEKHIYHNKPPYRLLLNLAILILVSIQVSIIFSEQVGLTRAQMRLFDTAILDWDGDGIANTHLRSADDIKHNLDKVQDFLQNLNTKLFQNVNLSNSNFSILSYAKYTQDGDIAESYPYNISEPIMSPFNSSNISSVQDFFDNTVKMVISGENILTTVASNNQLLNCYNWSISINYDNQMLNILKVTVRETSEPCNGDISVDYENTPNAEAIFYISLGVCVTAFISLMLILLHYVKVIKMYMDAQSMYQQYKKKNNLNNPIIRKYSEEYKEAFQYNSWAELPFVLKLKFLNGWRVFNFVGNMFQFFSSLIVLTVYLFNDPNDLFTVGRVLLGIGVLCAWVQIFEFLEFWDGLILITQTFQKSSKEVKVYWLLVIPIAIGYGLVGYSLFWKYNLYDTFGTSMRTLFALSCGDTVHESFEDMINEGMLKQIWVILAVLMFYTAGQNLFYVVILEGYERAKIRDEFDRNDPFPTIENLFKEKIKEVREKENEQALELLAEWEEQHGLKDSVTEFLEDPELDPSERTTIENLFGELKNAKLALMSISNQHKKSMDADEGFRKYVKNQVEFHLTHLDKKIKYYQSLYS